VVETPYRFGETASERLEVVDSLWFNPEERASFVLGLIEAGRQHVDLPYDPSFYDMLCFACQWIGRISIHELEGDKELYAIAVKLNQWLYSRHYFHTRDILGEPDKKEKVDAKRGQEPAGPVRDDSEVSGRSTCCRPASISPRTNAARSSGLNQRESTTSSRSLAVSPNRYGVSTTRIHLHL